MQISTVAKLARKLYVRMQITEMLPLEKYEIFIKPDFDSASWRFHQGKHQVVIGSYIFNNITKEVTDKEKALYVRSYLYHELAHSIWTGRDLEAMSKKLKELRFSFSMYNLFEDARIEEKMRHHLQKRFNWLKYEKIQLIQNPVEVFYYLIQAEGNKKAINYIEANLESSVAHHFSTIELFYKKAIDCETEEQMIELLKKWYDKFPNTPEYEEENILKSYTFNMESKYVEDEAFEELIDGLDNLLVGDISINSKTKEYKDSLVAIRLKRGSKKTLLASSPLEVAFERQIRDKLLDKMKTIFLSPARMSSSRLPSKRLNIKNIVLKKEKIYKRRDRVKFTKQRVTIVLDLSGSMYSTIKHMRLILDVLNKMVERNLLDATLILSGVSNSKALCESYTLPLAEGILERIVPNFEAEGLDNAMSSNLTTLQKSDYVWIFTDGMICEGPIDKKFYHKHNITTHAFYIGEDDYKHALETSFDYVICQKSVIDLTNKIFMLVK